MEDRKELSVSPAEIKESILESYASFCRFFQEDGWFDPVHEKLCDFVQYHILEAMSRPEEDPASVAKIMLIMPRGSLKTTIITKYLPAWLSCRDQNFRTLIATNTHPNARKKVQDIRGLFTANTSFKTLFPELLPTDSCRWTDECAELPRSQHFPEGTFEACGMKTRKEGAHYNLIIEDDTTAPDLSDTGTDSTVPSLEDIEHAIGWHKKSTGLQVPKGGRARIIVSTRWSENDLIAYVKENEPNYKVFDMPAIGEDGQPNFTMFYSLTQLAEIKNQVGEYLFSSMYMNRPLDPSLRTFKDDNIQYLPAHEVPTDGYVTLAIDPAISERDSSCETAITLVRHVMKGGSSPYQYWLKDVHGHMNPLQTVDRALDLAIEYGVQLIIVETNAYQKALKFSLNDEMIKRGISIKIRTTNSRQDKKVRIFAMEPLFSNSRVFLVRGLTKQVESQLRQFPNGRDVDIIDSFSMHLLAYRGERIPTLAFSPEQVNRMELEEICKELRGKFTMMQQGSGVLKTGLEEAEVDFSNCLSTGLGASVDASILVERYS